MERRKVYAILLLFVIPALAYGNLANNPSMEGNFIYQDGWGDIAEYWTSWWEPGGTVCQPLPNFDEGSYAHDGTKSQEISCLLKGGCGKVPLFGAGFYQQITSLQPGAIYRASVWFKFQFSANGGLGAGIRFNVGTDPNGGTDVRVVSDWNSVIDSHMGQDYQGPWRNVVLFFSPNTPSATLFIGAAGYFLALGPYGCWSDCYIDDVNVQLIQIIPPVDIKPGSCPNPLNVKSKGILPVAILGTEFFDVNTIDIASIRLEGVDPNRSSFEDVATPVLYGNECDCNTIGPDGYLDLTLKFETQEIVQAIGDVNDGDVVPLTLEGVLFEELGGTPIEGKDCIVVRGKHKAFNKGDINKDGKVDYVDFAIVAENWLESTIVQD